VIRWRRRRPTTAAERALADAGRLASRGKRLDAIQLLTEANRAQRDRAIERRLVDLRFAAFRRSRRSTALSPWPDSVDDRFPDARIPEIRRDEFTVDNLRSAIWNHGSVIVRGLVGPARVETLKTDIDTAFAAYDAWASGEEQPDVAGWYTPIEMPRVGDAQRADKRQNGSILAVESPPALFDLIEVFKEDGIGAVIDDHLGEPTTVLARKVTLRRLPRKGSGGWHQDGAFMGEGLRSINVWLALSHCGDHAAPGLDVVGKRLAHIVPPGGGSKPYGVSAERAEAVAEGTIVRPVFEPGDALVFDQLLLHRTGHDPDAQNDRYAIETWWMAPSTYGAMVSPRADGRRPDDQVPLVF
jgi:hypothetical protein